MPHRMILLTTCILLFAACGSAAISPWLDASKPIAERVDAIMAEMTLTERIRQLYAVHNYDGSEVAKFNTTSFGSLKLSSFKQEDPSAQVTVRNQLQAIFINSSRLHIPLSWPQETLASGGPNGVLFPLPITLGASWNITLVEAVHRVLAYEARVTGVDLGYSPEINLYTDPRFGRIQEGFSEDPELTSQLGVAAVNGLQQTPGSGPGTYLPSMAVAALAKHWVAYGAADMNARPTDMSERMFRSIYLEPWRRLVQAGKRIDTKRFFLSLLPSPAPVEICFSITFDVDTGLRGLMPSHQPLFDVPVHGNEWLGQTVLRQELGFDGISTSDCSDIGALYYWKVAANFTASAVQGVQAGVDMENRCGTNADGLYSYDHLEEAVQQGLVDEKWINQSASRVLAHKFASGLFDNPMTATDKFDQLNNASAQAIAIQAAQQGIVLLNNSDTLLPLNMAAYKSIAIVGQNAACYGSEGSPCNAQMNALGKTLHVLGNKANISMVASEAQARFPAINILTALGSPINTRATEADLAAAVSIAQDADITIAVLGDSMKSCAEFGDRDSLDLPSDQLELLARLLALGKPVVVVLVHGRPATFWHNGSNLLDTASTVLTAFRPGQAGGEAIWNVLTGLAEPIGRLPQAWPRQTGQIGGPANPWYQAVNGKWNMNTRGPLYPDGTYPFDPYVFAPSSPQYPFGYGLGYGNVTITALIGSHDPRTASTNFNVTVANPGSTPTTHLVQLYATTPVTSLVPLRRRLVAFVHVAVPAKGTTTVPLTVIDDRLMTWQSQTPGAPSGLQRVLVRGSYRFVAARHSLSDDASVMVTV